MLPEFQHLIITTRPPARALGHMLKGQPNLAWMQGSISQENLPRILRLRPVAFFNHLSWDLQPVDRRWLKKYHNTESPVVISFCHSINTIRELPKCLDQVDKAIVFSHYLEDENLESVIFSEYLKPKIKQIPNIFDDHELTTVNIRPPSEKEIFVVGNITNSAPWKHSEDFEEILSAINQVCSNTYFLFLGATRLSIDTSAIKNYHFYSPFEISVKNYFETIHVLIHKTRSDTVETWCRVVTEAMFAGVPVVAERKGGIREQIIHGETGFLCETPNEFAHYVWQLSANPGLYEAISKNAREYAVEHFGYRVSRNNLLNLLNNNN
ncbi:MAG TPA: hypothetical protein DCX03_09965 [Bacteroidales bacterium]|nr:hypothetical protein [Bacteroidales bacterium]